MDVSGTASKIRDIPNDHLAYGNGNMNWYKTSSTVSCKVTRY